MRIDAFNQVAQIYGRQNNIKTTRSQATSGASDQLSISQVGKDIQVAKSAVSQASDIREDKVAALKSQIASGSYQVNEGDFASVLLDKYNAIL